MSTETRPIAGYPNYQVTSTGEVIGPRGKALKPELTEKGYHRVWLHNMHGRKRKRVHLLVCESFHGTCPTGHECRHLDGVRTHNHAGNLAWGTKAHNADDKRRHGTLLSGERHPGAKLSDDQVQDLMFMRDAGIKLKEIASYYRIDKSHASRLARAKRKPTAWQTPLGRATTAEATLTCQ